MSRVHWRSGCPCCEGTVRGSPPFSVRRCGSRGGLPRGTDQQPRKAPLLRPNACGAPVLRGGYIITMDAALGDIPIGRRACARWRDRAVAPSITAPDAEIIDAQGKIVMPGFIETHSHVGMRCSRTCAGWASTISR
jgi:hypothetical protein